MRYLTILTVFVGFGCISPDSVERQSESEIISNKNEIYEQISANWDEVLSVWYPRALDTIYGGYLANWTFDWQEAELQNKMIVTQARHLWTTSQVLLDDPNNILYQQAGRLGFDFLKNQMWDQTNGGFYWLVDRSGQPILDGENRYKRIYGQAFGIYALAAYAQVNKSDEVLFFAKDAFIWLDEHAHDTDNHGYYSVLNHSGEPLSTTEQIDADLPITWIYKEQNAGIHLMEAFTELYRVWPDSLVRHRLIEMLHLVRDTMVNDSNHLNLFFTSDWQPITYADSSQKAREANYQIDHVSFGHDIETAFLMLDASEALNNYEYEKTLQVAKALVDHTLETGFDSTNSGIYQRGYYLPGDTTVSIIDYDKDWWSQAEGLNTLLIFAELYPENSQYADEFAKLWKYTQTYMIDSLNMGWYTLGLDQTPQSRTAPKGQAWKGNYHNGRTLMAIKNRLAP